MKKWGKFCSILCMLIFTVTLLPINAFGEELTEDGTVFELYDGFAIEEEYDDDPGNDDTWPCDEQCVKERFVYRINVTIGAKLILSNPPSPTNAPAYLILLEDELERYRGSLYYDSGRWLGSIQFLQEHIFYLCIYCSPVFVSFTEDFTHLLDITSWRIELPTGIRSHEPLAGPLEGVTGGDRELSANIYVQVERYDTNAQETPTPDGNNNGSQNINRPPSPQTGDSLQVLPSLMNLIASIILLRFWYKKRRERY